MLGYVDVGDVLTELFAGTLINFITGCASLAAIINTSARTCKIL